MKLCALIVAAAGLLTAADPLAEVFSRMDEAAAHFTGMTADLKKTVHIEIVDDNNIDTGTIKLRRTKKGDVRFLVEFQGPDARAAAYAGNEIDLFNPKTNTVSMVDVADKKSMIEQLMLLGFGATSAELKATYDVAFVGAEKLDGQATSHIRLTPKSKDMLNQLKEAELWISDAQGVPIQQKFRTTKAGDYNLFQYHNLKLTAALKDDDLRLKLPKNVEKRRVGAGSSK
jgi:outer membrane lipoprotein-sorting protein